tara:strand:- start:6218 stop:6949 length:732 start_codon:yes stop_codon:yes gene_type:complete
MTTDQDKIINELINKGLDGDMDSVNQHPDRMVRAKAKAMIIKIQKGKAERPSMPGISSSSGDQPSEPVGLKDQEKPEPKLEPSFNEKLEKLIDQLFPGSLLDSNGGEYFNLKPRNWLDIAKWLKSDPALFFDSLQCQMGIDVGDGMLESRYNFHSMKHDHYLEVRINVPVSEPKIPSVESVWRIADWFERETYDMLGIEFTGHRNLRRILLPDDWEGWPLRKDYEVQETYHGIVVPKMKEGWE